MEEAFSEKGGKGGAFTRQFKFVNEDNFDYNRRRERSILKS
jgi:hypothetical protein